jgi:hypothetical protein
LVGAAVKVEMTTLFAPCVGVSCAFTPQEVRMKRNTPAKRETWHFFILTTFPGFELLSLKFASYMTISGPKRYIAILVLIVFWKYKKNAFGSERFTNRYLMNHENASRLETISNNKARSLFLHIKESR